MWPFGELSWLNINYQMDIISTVLIAFELAMDCFAISFTSGVTLNKIRIRGTAKIGMFLVVSRRLCPY
ncbi:MAG: hypothetical protein QXG44_08910 [Candidatus Jordarchaeaceae archaeon]